MTRKEIQKLVDQEMDRQESKWGEQRNQHPATWLTILTEEVGEMAKEICDAEFDVAALSENYKTELVQIAAVAQSAIKDIENYSTENQEQ